MSRTATTPISIETVENLMLKHVREFVSPQLVAKPVVSVVVATFNHRPHVQQCVESILAQDTNFDFEIIIADDCSTDGTTEIVQRLQAEFPERIRLLCTDKNLWEPKPGVFAVMPLAALLRTRGRYLSIIDGDDYLSSTAKFQHDVDFLEANPGYNLCFHNAVVEEEGMRQELKRLWMRHESNDRDFSFEELAAHFVPPTAGMMMRNLGLQLPKRPWMIFSNLRLIGICLITLSGGKARYFAASMSVYRVTKSGQAASEMHPGKHLDDLLANFGMLYGALNVEFQFEKHVALFEGLKKNIERLTESHFRHSAPLRLETVSIGQLIHVMILKIKGRFWNTLSKN
jgi:glycosyltransferase involved in cell wall biosynthesis